jgi:hypothetical protein
VAGKSTVRMIWSEHLLAVGMICHAWLSRMTLYMLPMGASTDERDHITQLVVPYDRQQEATTVPSHASIT